MRAVLGREWLLDESHLLGGLGFRVRSDLPEARVLSRLLDRMEHATAGTEDIVYSLTGDAGDPGSYALHVGEDFVGNTSSGAWMFDWIMADVTRRSLAPNTDVLALHAGAVSIDGAGVLLPAPPGHGKSTLTCGLILDGFDLLSDEAALLRLTEPVIDPFPRPISLEEPSLDLLPGLRERLALTYGAFLADRAFVAAEDLRSGSASAPCRVRHVVLPTYEEGTPTRLTPLAKAEALASMTAQCFNRRVVGGRTLEVLAAALEHSTCHRLTMGDLPSAVAAIRELTSGPQLA